MIKVYFESGRHAECVATFISEEVYMACLPILEVLASEQRMTITENIEIDMEMDLQYQKAHEGIEEAEWEYEMSKVLQEEDPEEAMNRYNEMEEDEEFRYQQEMLKAEQEMSLEALAESQGMSVTESIEED